jgi:nucleotide-binding universal stress UspA family protein
MYSRILVPIDGSDPANCGLREAIGIARSSQAKLVLLNVARESPMMTDGLSMAYYNDLLASLQRAGEAMIAKAVKTVTEAGLECESVVVDAGAKSAWEAIIEQIANSRCDLVVMGTHGRRGLKRLTMGSDAELVVRHAPVPVLLVKPAAAAA